VNRNERGAGDRCRALCRCEQTKPVGVAGQDDRVRQPRQQNHDAIFQVLDRHARIELTKQRVGECRVIARGDVAEPLTAVGELAQAVIAPKHERGATRDVSCGGRPAGSQIDDTPRSDRQVGRLRRDASAVCLWDPLCV